MWVSEFQMRNSMRDNRVSVRVYNHSDVMVDRVSNFEKGLEADR